MLSVLANSTQDVNVIAKCMYCCCFFCNHGMISEKYKQKICAINTKYKYLKIIANVWLCNTYISEFNILLKMILFQVIIKFTTFPYFRFLTGIFLKLLSTAILRHVLPNGYHVFNSA